MMNKSHADMSSPLARHVDIDPMQRSLSLLKLARSLYGHMTTWLNSPNVGNPVLALFMTSAPLNISQPSPSPPPQLYKVSP